MFDGKYSDFRAEGGSVSNPDARKEQGPKKVRHISDDDWEKQAKKFNSGKGFSDDRKKKKSFNRDDRKRSYDSVPKGRYSNDDDDDFDGFQPVGRADSRQRRDGYGYERRNDRPSYGKPARQGYGRPDRKDRADSGDRKPFKKERGDDNFKRERRIQESQGYNPANSRGPRLPESSETIINPVHMRQRKGWKKREEED